ncbi:MAG: hypothetical protein L3J59_15660 [Methylococcaceae bacterium]|nr:hypothetical protein [Methylococcaceae bacterium]
MPGVAAAVASIIAWFGSFLTASVIRYIAIKAVIVGVVVIILPIVINNIVYKFMQMAVNFAGNNSPDNSFIGSLTFNASGMLAYVIDAMSIPEAFSIVMSALALKFTLSFFSFKNLWLMR